jgi:hypothetical protein
MDCFGFAAWRPEELQHMCALSVFRSCGGTVNRVHDTRVLKLRSSPHFQQTYVPSFITLEPMNIGMSHTSRTRKSCRNIRETSPCPPFLSPSLKHAEHTACKIESKGKRAATNVHPQKEGNKIPWAPHHAHDHELLHAKLKSSSSSAPDRLLFRIPSLRDLVTSSTVFPRFRLPVFSSPSSVPSATNL